MALMQITIIPVGTASTGVGNYIADVERFLQGRGIEHSLGDMGTVIHGDSGDLFQLANDIHNLPFHKGAQRVVTQIMIDDRRDRKRGIGEKREAVMQRLQREGA